MELKTNQYVLLFSYKPLRKTQLVKKHSRVVNFGLAKGEEELVGLVNFIPAKSYGTQTMVKLEANLTPRLGSTSTLIEVWKKGDGTYLSRVQFQRIGITFFEVLLSADSIDKLNFSVRSRVDYHLPSSEEGQKIMQEIPGSTRLFSGMTHFNMAFVEDTEGKAVISSNKEQMYRFSDVDVMWKSEFGACIAQQTGQYQKYPKKEVHERLASLMAAILKETTWYIKKILEVLQVTQYQPTEKEQILTIYVEGISINISKLRFFYRQAMLLPLGQIKGRFKIIQGSFDESEKTILRVTIHFLENTSRLEKFTPDLIKTWFESEAGVSMSPKIYKLILWKTLETNDNMQTVIDFNDPLVDTMIDTIAKQKQVEEKLGNHPLWCCNLENSEMLETTFQDFLHSYFNMDSLATFDLLQKTPALLFGGYINMSRGNPLLQRKPDTQSFRLLDLDRSVGQSQLDQKSLSRIHDLKDNILYSVEDKKVVAVDIMDCCKKGTIETKFLAHVESTPITMSASTTLLSFVLEDDLSDSCKYLLTIYHLAHDRCSFEDDYLMKDGPIEEYFTEAIKGIKEEEIVIQSYGDFIEYGFDLYSASQSKKPAVYGVKSFRKGVLLICRADMREKQSHFVYRWMAFSKGEIVLSKDILTLLDRSRASKLDQELVLFELHRVPYLFDVPAPSRPAGILRAVLKSRFVTLSTNCLEKPLQRYLNRLSSDKKLVYWSVEKRPTKIFLILTSVDSESIAQSRINLLC